MAPAKLLAELLFAPASVALVGASSDYSKVSSRPLRYLRAQGFAGRLHPVNPRGGEIEGFAVSPSLDALPEVPDHAFVLTGPDAALAGLADCVRLGVPLVSILADGFGEAGPDGEVREARLRALLEGSGTRLLGPNCMGLANPSIGLALTANAALAEIERHPGGFMLASHSGGMLGTLLSRGGARGIGFSRLISLGNESDLDVAEVCLACVDDPEVTGFLLFLETIRSAATLSRLAHAADARSKPVIAYQLGRSEVGRALAVTHTGAMMADRDLVSASLRDLGIARVHHLEALFEATPLFARPLPATERRQVGVVTTTGGGAAMVADGLGLEGAAVVGPGRATLDRLRAEGIALREAPIADLTLAGARPDTLRTALRILAEEEAFDLLVVVIGSSAAASPETIMPPIVEQAQASPIPVAVFVVPEAPSALRICAEAGVAAFRTPEACADAVAALLARRPPRVSIEPPAPPTGRRVLDEAASLALLNGVGVAAAPHVVLPAREAPPALTFDYPVVAKAALPGLAHKSDAGGVVLGIDGPDELAQAMARIVREVDRATGKRVERIAVACQMAPLAELLLGFRVDPVFGPVVMLAPGGVDAELGVERAVRLAPVNRQTARGMIAELTLSRRLAGYRHVPPADVEALADAIARFSRPGETVVEAEINPLAVLREGVVALDGLVVVREEA